MNIALVGCTGYIAGFLLERFYKEPNISNILKIDKNESADIVLNLEEAEKFDYTVLNKIDYIIFTAAISGPDKCALDFEWCWSINVTGTSYFINEAIKRDCNVLFFSSDAVFGDIPGEIYTEESQTNTTTPYGRMKKAVEDTFKNETHFKTIRLSYVVSAKDRFVLYCLKCINEDTVANIYHPFYRNCIVVSDVVDLVIWFVNNWRIYKPSVLNAAGIELVSRVRIADELNRNLENRLKYTITAPEDEFYINRPRITQMKSLYMQEYRILEENTFTEKFKKELAGFI